MKNIVTFETAKRLKDAGFAQPNPATGQFWYRGSVRIFKGPALNQEIFGAGAFVVNQMNSKIDHALMCGLDGCYDQDWWDVSVLTDKYIFAPTATDILSLPEMKDVAIRQSFFVGKWVAWIPSDFPSENDEIEATQTNPAEACAEAWLKINEK
jgi:hypothetical protein